MQSGGADLISRIGAESNSIDLKKSEDFSLKYEIVLPCKSHLTLPSCVRNFPSSDLADILNYMVDIFSSSDLADIFSMQQDK